MIIRPFPLMVSLSNHGPSFDKLRMSGNKIPLMVSLSNHRPPLDKLGMSGVALGMSGVVEAKESPPPALELPTGAGHARGRVRGVTAGAVRPPEASLGVPWLASAR